MKYVHIRSLEKYHPGYKDRSLQWAKIHFRMVQGDPDCDLIENEVDWARLIKMILLELQAQQPLPNSDAYWTRKGFDIKKRPMSLTLKMLHNFIEECENPLRRVDKEVDKDNKSKIVIQPPDFLTAIKNNPAYKGIDIDSELSKMDAWLLTKPGRKKTKQFVVNWLNRIDKGLPSQTPLRVPSVVKCPVPGCSAQPMAQDQYLAHRTDCEKKFKSSNGAMSPEVRKLVNVACGRAPGDDGK